MAETKINVAGKEDAEIIASFNQAMALETEGKVLDWERLLAGTHGLIENAERGFYLLCLRGDEVLGQLMVTYEWSDWRNGTFWWIQSVFVKKEARRQGVYRALYERVQMLAKGTPNVCGLRLYVEHDNSHAQETYVALGMKKCAYHMYEVDFVLS